MAPLLIALVLVGVACCSLLGCASTEGESGRPETARPLSVARSPWLDGPQIYTNLGVSAEIADRLGVTVNGLWNGWGMKKSVVSMHPSLMLWRTKQEGAYVAKFHDGGFLHGSTLSCAYALQSEVNRRPELRQAVCRTAQDKTFVMDGGWYLGKQPFMCQNAPAWQDELLARAERIIDAGSDAIVLDEPFGETFFAGLPIPGFPGFSDYDMEALAADIEARYTSEEREARFGVPSLPASTLRSIFAGVKVEKAGNNGDGSRSDPSTSPVGRLWLHYQAFQRRENGRTKGRLVEAIREYSKKDGRGPIPIGANLAELDGYYAIGQMPVLYMAELFDFFAYEAAYRYAPEKRGDRKGKDSFILSERGKWVPLHALGEAVVGPYRALAYPSQELVEALLEPGKKINYLCRLLAEAQASRAGLIIPMWDFREKDLRALSRYTRFIRRNPAFYEALTPVAPIGVVYAHGDGSPPQHWSYLGAAQALYESGLPYSVIYATSGGGRPPLSRERLRGFQVVVVPMAGTLAAEARTALKDYVELDGGTVVLFRPDPDFALPPGEKRIPLGKGAFVVMGNGDLDEVGRTYFAEYADGLRALFAATVASCLKDGSPIELADPDRKWALLSYAQDAPDQRRRAVIHVLNYAYVPDEDRFETQRGVAFRVKAEDFGLILTDSLRCRAYAPERSEPIALSPIASSDGYVEIAIPELGMYEVVILE